MKQPRGRIALLCGAFVIPGFSAFSAFSGDRPHILWITAEDMSPTLGAYGDAYATTPNLDAFARESVLYTNAFASAPVCSPSRSTLITGMWAPSLGTSQMRSAFPIPPEVRGFPAYLREAGYFTTNQVKTDYNTKDEARIIRESWSKSSPTAHWRSGERKEGQPFFSVFNHMVTHQSRSMTWPHAVFLDEVQSKLSADERHDPAKAIIPPYYPDPEIIRRGIARYYDCVSVLDAEVGHLLEQLKADGLAEDTIVFFYSDHGSGMPRHKRLLHDSGMKVPLMIRFPEKYRHLAPAGAGETVDRLVTFVDFAPTVLSMAGVAVPDGLQGEIFLGPETSSEPEFVYGFRDRVDEVFDLSRSIRSQRYLYIRNYLPHLSWMQPSVYSDTGEIQREMRQHANDHAETLPAAVRAYVGPTRPVEEFYDVVSDPANVRNLLDGELAPGQADALEAHRAALKKKRLEILDLGVLPESIMAEHLIEENRSLREIALGKGKTRLDLGAIWDAADLVGKGTRDELIGLSHSDNDAIRFWGIIGLRQAFAGDVSGIDECSRLMDDESVAVRMEAASWLAEVSDRHRDKALQVLAREVSHQDWWVALRACRAIESLGPKAQSLVPVMEAVHTRHRNAPGDGSLFLAFSSSAFLEQMGMRIEPWDFSRNR